MDKYELLPQQLLHEGLISEAHFFHPPKISLDLLKLTHTEGYLSMLHNLPLERKMERAIGFPVREDLIERGKHIANGTLMCVDFALDSGASFNIAGGTHHAFADKGEGFCVFNDIAIATNVLLHNKVLDRILIIDLDVHQGNGTAKIFENEGRVFTLSIHGKKNYPIRKEHSDLDIGLEDKTGDREYLEVVEQTIEKIVLQHRPNIIFYLSGVDVLEVDKLGRLSLSKEACKARDTHVFEVAKLYKIPIVTVMGGGYAEKIADIIEAHANTYRAAFSIYS